MPAAINIPQVVSAQAASSNVISLSGMCGAQDNFLLAIFWSTTSTGPVGPGSGFTYNGVQLSQFIVANALDLKSIAYIYYMANPPVGGAYTLQASCFSNFDGAALGFIPIAGVNTSNSYKSPNGNPYQTVATSVANNNGAISWINPAQASAKDLYIAVCGNGCTSQSSGSGQSLLWTQTNIGSGYSVSADQIPGANAGSFTWANSGSVTATAWDAIELLIPGMVPFSSYAIDEQMEF
jgi:hypothetical protein